MSGPDSFQQDIPQEFSDEDRWQLGRFSFSKKSFIVLLSGFGVTYMLFKIMSFIHASTVGVILGITLTVIAVFLSMFPMPESDYIKGGGLTLDIILLRKLVRRRNRIVYTKGISNYGARRTTRQRR